MTILKNGYILDRRSVNREEQDSNLRFIKKLVFQSSAFDHSATFFLKKYFEEEGVR